MNEPRDYAAEMRIVIDKAAPCGQPYTRPRVAAEIAEHLAAEDPDLLHGWLAAQAPVFIAAAIASRDHSRRSHIRATSARSAFAEAAAAHEAGEDADAAFATYLDFPLNVAEGTKPLGKADHNDLVFAGRDYRGREARNKFYATVMEALAERVTTGVVEDYYTASQLGAIFGSFR